MYQKNSDQRNKFTAHCFVSSILILVILVCHSLVKTFHFRFLSAHVIGAYHAVTFFPLMMTRLHCAT